MSLILEHLDERLGCGAEPKSVNDVVVVRILTNEERWVSLLFLSALFGPYRL